jgi:hypothetical protein
MVSDSGTKEQNTNGGAHHHESASQNRAMRRDEVKTPNPSSEVQFRRV